MNKLKVGIYLRLSNEDKDKIDESESIKNQRNMLIDYINKNDNFILTDEYSDVDISGAGSYRPEFERLIKDCQNKKLDIVLCKSQSRFSRDMEIVEKYINNKFKEWNIRFISLSDNADTFNIGNKKSRQINGLVNEWYLEDVSNNIRSAFNSKMKQGEFISPFASFGYEIDKNNNNKLIIDKEASIIVKEIFNLYLKGYGYTKIAKYLNEKKVPSPSLYKYKKGIKLNINSNKPIEDIKWNNNAIKRILINEIYIGNLIQGKRTTVSYKNHKIINKPKDKWIKIEKTHEKIIDSDTFNKVKNAIKERTKPLKKTKTYHIFSGKVFCNKCKSYMRKKNSGKNIYLVCSNNYEKICNNKSIRYDTLEKIILDSINEKVKEFYDFEILKNKEINNNYIKEINLLTKEKNEIINKTTNIKKYIKNLYEDKVNNIISKNQFMELINDYNDEENNLNNRLKVIDNEINLYKKKDNNKDILKEFNGFKKLDKIIVDEFVNKIYINDIDNNTRDIKIKWNF